MDNRMNAAKRGEVSYTGEPCIKCGATVRYVLDGRCKACAVSSAKRRGINYREALAAARSA